MTTKEEKVREAIVASAPEGEDEARVKELFLANSPIVAWEELSEWQRASWRLEYRNE